MNLEFLALSVLAGLEASGLLLSWPLQQWLIGVQCYPKLLNWVLGMQTQAHSSLGSKDSTSWAIPQSFYTKGFLRSYPAYVLVSFSWQAVRRRHCPWRLHQNITPQTERKELTSNLLCREDSGPQKERFGCGCRGQQPWEANFSYPWLIGNHEAWYTFEKKKHS